MLVELSPATWLALRALAEEALAEPSDATPLLRKALQELAQSAQSFKAATAPDAPLAGDTQLN